MSARRKAAPPTFETTTRLRYEVELPESVYQRIKNEVVKAKFWTPYMLAEKFNLTVSLAKKVLRRLEKEGVVKLYVFNRRAPIYVPVKKSQ